MVTWEQSVKKLTDVRTEAKSLVIPTEQRETVREDLVTNDTLALRWRPRRLKDIAGQEGVVQEMEGMFKGKEVPNAIAIIGPSGVGKTTFARMISHYFNCERGTACGKCDVCVAIDGGKLPPDYIEINAATDGGIDAIKAIIESSRLRPKNRLRIIYIDEAHRLTLAAANALLKPMEEPAKQTMWIIATTDPEKIPNSKAILGRCARFHLSTVSPDKIGARLMTISKAERFRWMNDAAARLIGEASAGHVRDAVQILDQVRKKVEALDRVPRGGRLLRLIKKLSIETSESSLDGTVKALLVALYSGDARGVQRAILDAADEPVPLGIKALFVNWYLVNVLGGTSRHAKVWHTKQNTETLAAIKAKNKQVGFGTAVLIHKELTRARTEMTAFATDGYNVLTSVLTDLALDLGDK